MSGFDACSHQSHPTEKAMGYCSLQSPTLGAMCCSPWWLACGWCTEDLGGFLGASSVLPGKECAWTCLNLGAAVGQG